MATACGALVVLAGLSLPVGPAAAATTFEGRMLELINGARATAGLAPVQLSPGASGVATGDTYMGCGYAVSGRSVDMGVRNYFSHSILNCGTKSAADMLQAASIPFAGFGENIAWISGTSDPVAAAERIHSDLMASDAHRANILKPGFTQVGIGSWRTPSGTTWSGGGYALGNVYVATEIFMSMSTSPSPSGSRYHPLTPSRILDTRNGAGRLGPAATMDVQVTGSGGVPTSGVSAVVLNMAITGPTAPSYLTVFPAGQSMPLAANLNFTAGQTVTNLVTAKLGAGGRLSIYNSAGTTEVIADVNGWYDDGTASTGARFHPLTPGRILDTRNGIGTLGASATMDLQVTGQGGIPTSGVTAVVMNVTVTGPTAPSYLTVFPTAETRPLASNLNFTSGQTVPNLVTAKLGNGGRVSIYNSAGSTHIVADVAGWYDDGTTAGGAGFHPVTPSRIMDTRNGGGPVDASAARDLQVTGQGGVPATGVSAVIANVTVTGPTAPSYLVAYPTGEARPWAANLNFLPGQTVPNLVVAKLGAGGQITLANSAGSTHVIADVAGWFDVG